MSRVHAGAGRRSGACTHRGGRRPAALIEVTACWAYKEAGMLCQRRAEEGQGYGNRKNGDRRRRGPGMQRRRRTGRQAEAGEDDGRLATRASEGGDRAVCELSGERENRSKEWQVGRGRGCAIWVKSPFFRQPDPSRRKLP
jgi:hypothetical protein